LTSLAKLQHLPTFKEKVKLHQENVNLGLLSYPVLMAADILIYKADFVPVGKDQLPHIEFTREIARKFNGLFGKTFPEPKALLTEGADIRSLTDPNQKMSKSLGEQSYIALTDSPEVIRNKVAKAVTDVGPQKGKKMSPGIANLFTLMKEFSSEESYKYFQSEYKKGTIKYSEMKKALAKDMAKAFESFRKKRAKLAKSPSYVKKVLEDRERRARKIAQETMAEVKKKIGLL
jgi:tryptophanyl-tRNA synthetase